MRTSFYRVAEYGFSYGVQCVLQQCGTPQHPMEAHSRGSYVKVQHLAYINPLQIYITFGVVQNLFHSFGNPKRESYVIDLLHKAIIHP